MNIKSIPFVKLVYDKLNRQGWRAYPSCWLDGQLNWVSTTWQYRNAMGEYWSYRWCLLRLQHPDSAVITTVMIYSEATEPKLKFDKLEGWRQDDLVYENLIIRWDMAQLTKLLDRTAELFQEIRVMNQARPR